MSNRKNRNCVGSMNCVDSMNSWKRFFMEEDGVGVVEIILILVVLIALVAIFKTRLTALVQKIFQNIEKQAGKI